MPSLDRIKPTQNDEAAAVLMDAHEYDKLQEQLTMMQLLNMSERDQREGRTRSLEDIKQRLAKHHSKRQKK